MLKPGLQLQIGQQLTMTPQLQQAIHLLQLSTLDLHAEIQEILEANPLLEVAESHEEESAATDIEPIDYRSAEEALARSDDPLPLDISHNESLPDELPVDAAWEDVFANGSLHSAQRSGTDDDDNLLETLNAAPETLADLLAWQFNLTPFSATDHLIGLAILDAIDERGYLTASLNDILIAAQNAAPEQNIELDEVEAVLHRIQQFDPPGVAAIDLRDCLLIQLHQLSDNTPHRTTAITIIKDHLKLLGSRDFAQLMRTLKLTETGLKSAISLIQTLNPNPGGLMSAADDTEYITPDVVVRRVKNRWLVELNADAMPRLRINPSYASLVRQSNTEGTQLRGQLQEANWFLRSLQSRNDTLLKVATCIVEHQRAFLEQGPEAMKPLVLREVAEEVDMHESSISRATSQKYLHTPRGIFELKYFFSSHVGTSDGGEASSIAIRAMIKKLVSAENPRKPLSDNKITDLLQEQGIAVARRTVAKYRESLNIPPSNERKHLG